MFNHLAMWTWPNSTWAEDPERMAARLAEAHIDIIVPYANPTQGSAPKDGDIRREFDERLRAIIEAGHRRDMRIHGCFDEMNAYESMPVYHLCQVRQDGSMGRTLCPANPEVVEYILGELARVLREFDYDGINLEDGYVYNHNSIYDPAHTPGEDYYSIPVCCCAYCQAHAPIGRPEWGRWRQERMTALIAEESRLLRERKPGIPFSVAARMPYDVTNYRAYQQEIPYYSGWKFCQSRDGLDADWAGWLRNGLIDFACPMSYFSTPRLVELQTRECQQEIPRAAEDVWMGLGIGDYVVEYLATCGGDPSNPGESADPTQRCDARVLDRLLAQQASLGQHNVIFFCYQFLQDEHIPVMARYREQ